jgi:hypothetical protein
MYLLLLVFGAVLTAAGIVLAASGISIHDRAFDTSVVTPGTVAVIGGLVLFGLGLALRVLQRIEQSLTARQMPRALRLGEATEAAIPEPQGGSAQIPFPAKAVPKAVVLSHGAPVATVAAPAAAKEPRLVDLPATLTEELAGKTLAAAQFESARVVEESALMPRALLPSAAPRADVEIGEVNVRTARRIVGAAPARIMPRLNLGAGLSPTRPSILPEQPKSPAFDSLWPKGSRPLRGAQLLSAKPLPAPPVTAVMAEPEQSSEPTFDLPAAATLDVAPAPVTVLKSGAVDGMAYTLYSDGSIEAELPQGPLRFGSITALRNHIEQSS